MRNKTKTYLRSLLLLAAASLLLAFCACAHDGPPKIDQPPLKPLNGVYSCEYGKLIFNGDEKSIKVEVTKALSQLTGMPEGTHEGTYVFIFDHGMWRYDSSDVFRIMLSDKTYEFRNDFTSTCYDRIVISSNGAEPTAMSFERQAD